MLYQFPRHLKRNIQCKDSIKPVSTFNDYKAFSEIVGVFRRNLYSFGDIFGDSSEMFGGSSVHPSFQQKSFSATQDGGNPTTCNDFVASESKAEYTGVPNRYLLLPNLCNLLYTEISYS